MVNAGGIQRRHLLVNGIVQGVGFRPFVFNLAEDLDLAGFVSNTSAGVVIEIEGPAEALDQFCQRLRDDAPPLADVVSVEVEDREPENQKPEFQIRHSENTPGTNTSIPPDVTVCADCRREITDPANRRHGYPFTNCTNCGPRWTIIGRVPYDRPFTSMAHFKMCPSCQAEYDNPRDRRFHAQPNACPECGPQVWLQDGRGARILDDVLTRAAIELADSRILAIKGLGGFHLAVRADQPEAVERLRHRKTREAKPLAVMCLDVDGARRLAEVDAAEEEMLTSPAAPIVLLKKKAGAPLADSVCAGHRRVGVMLAYTPLHVLLLNKLAMLGVPALVMTSGNASDEPICLGNEEAVERLADIADQWLLHDRDILRRADDSVVQVIKCGPLFFRRGRGFAPVPVQLEADDDNTPDILGVGPELKNTVCLLKNGRAFLSPHIGDLENLEANNFFTATVDTLQDVLESTPRAVAHDMHPGYFSTRYAQQNIAVGVRKIPVQHHHAHLAAVMGEHQLTEPVIGLILDGTGYGTDGTIWGGEVLVGDAHSFERFAHLQTVPLPGGEAAIKQPWRTAVSYLRCAFGDDVATWPKLDFLADKPVAPVLEILEKGLNSPLTSSCGRLFDAVAALTGRWDEVHYEAQAAIELMALTNFADVLQAEPLVRLDWGADLPQDAPLEMPVEPIIKAAAKLVASGGTAAELSARFHRTLIDLLVAVALVARDETGLDDVVLAGGVFQNEFLVRGLFTLLPDHDLRVWRNLQCPANDGAVALGQVVVARAVVGPTVLED